MQELGQLERTFKKDHKLDLMHIAICKLYSLMVITSSILLMKMVGHITTCWKTYHHLKAGEQSVLMKEAIVNYFLETEYIN